MSIVDKVVAAVMPMESEEARQKARTNAMAKAKPGGWLEVVLKHHQQIEAAFREVAGATSAATRVKAQKALAEILTAHSIAEEAVLYPAMAHADDEGHATMAYTEQAATKLQLGLLQRLPPMSKDYLDKLEHIRGAVAHHVYEEEGTWFITLAEKLTPAEQAELAERYQEEFDRYAGGNSPQGARKVA